MSLVTMKEILSESIEKKYAVAGFVSISHYYTEAIIQALTETGTPGILQFPDFLFDQMDDPKLFFRCTNDMVRSAKVPICIHLDHGPSFESCVKAIHYGFTSVMYDGSRLSNEENIANTRKIVEMAHAVDITVEAEIGHVGGAEKPEDGWKEIEADSSMYTRPDDAVDFVARTGVDALAVAIGSVHGVYRGTPKLDIERLKELRKAVDIPLVMHGGSGLPDSAFRAAIENGINKINFFTGMSLAATETVREKLKEAGDRKMYLQELHIPAKQTMVDIMKRTIATFGTQPLSSQK